MGRTKKKRKRKVGPYKADEIESVQKKPKKKKKKKELLPPEPWLDVPEKQPYFQDGLERRQKLPEKLASDKKREPWIWKERFFQDQFADFLIHGKNLKNANSV